MSDTWTIWVYECSNPSCNTHTIGTGTTPHRCSGCRKRRTLSLYGTLPMTPWIRQPMAPPTRPNPTVPQRHI